MCGSTFEKGVRLGRPDSFGGSRSRVSRPHIPDPASCRTRGRPVRHVRRWNERVVSRVNGRRTQSRSPNGYRRDELRYNDIHAGVGRALSPSTVARFIRTGGPLRHAGWVNVVNDREQGLALIRSLQGHAKSAAAVQGGRLCFNTMALAFLGAFIDPSTRSRRLRRRQHCGDPAANRSHDCCCDDAANVSASDRDATARGYEGDR
jgi:hypothetical protein